MQKLIFHKSGRAIMIKIEFGWDFRLLEGNRNKMIHIGVFRAVGRFPGPREYINKFGQTQGLVCGHRVNITIWGL